MGYLTGTLPPNDFGLCAGLFVVCSRSNEVPAWKEKHFDSFVMTPVRGGSAKFLSENLDQEGTRYGN